MYIAQKTLKSMSSITNDANEVNDDFDDLIFTPKIGNFSPFLNTSTSGRQPSLVPPMDENGSADSPSEVAFETEVNRTNGMRIKKRFLNGLFYIGIMEMESPQVLEAKLITYESQSQLDPTKNSPPGSMDTFDFQ
jgi:hypothetical protein